MADEALAKRVADIFDKIESLNSTPISVEAGVVTLDRLAPNADAIARAGQIASAVGGVVTVENDLERDVSLETQLSPAVGTSVYLIQDAIQITLKLNR